MGRKFLEIGWCCVGKMNCCYHHKDLFSNCYFLYHPNNPTFCFVSCSFRTASCDSFWAHECCWCGGKHWNLVERVTYCHCGRTCTRYGRWTCGLATGRWVCRHLFVGDQALVRKSRSRRDSHPQLGLLWILLAIVGVN